LRIVYHVPARFFHRALSAPQHDPVTKKNRCGTAAHLYSHFIGVAADQRGEDRVVNRRKRYESILANKYTDHKG
jgi:hypothetical protein